MDLVHTLIEVAKLAGFAGVVTLPFTLYFASMRIGYRVAAIYTWQLSRLTAEGISAVTLMNLKDRPVAIFEIHAVMDGRSLSLKKFDPPFILKNMEATTIEIEPASFYYTEKEKFDLRDPLAGGGSIDFYLSTIDKNVKCLRKGPAQHYKILEKRSLKIIGKHVRRYNDHIINDEARYAILHSENGKEKTSFIDRQGFIHKWGYRINALHPNDLKDPNAVRDAIIRSGLEPYIKPFVIVDLDKENK